MSTTYTVRREPWKGSIMHFSSSLLLLFINCSSIVISYEYFLNFQCCTYVQCSYTQLSMSVVVKTSTFCYCSFLMLDCCLFYFIRTHQWPSAFWLIFRKVERIPEHTYHFDSIKFGLLRWLRKEKTSSFIGLPKKKTSSRLNIFRGSDHLNMFLFGIIITILDV